MTTYRDNTDAPDRKLTLAEILEIFAAGRLPLKFTAYDGSTAGPEDAELGLDLLTPRGTTYLATAPGDLGLARAYVAGDLEPHGVHPGDPYELLKALAEKMDFKRPPARVLANIVRSIGLEHLKPIAPPQKAVAEEGLTDLAEVRHGDYRDVRESGFDAVSSIGLTEHIGVHNYPSYFRFLKSKMRNGALLLNHCITRPENRTGPSAGGFIDRYV